MAWSNVTVSTSGNDVVINAAWWAAGVSPFIWTGSNFISWGSTQDIIVSWVYFSPGTVFSIPGFPGTINSQTALSPTQFRLNITVPAVTGTYDLVAANGAFTNTVWPWSWENYIVVDTVSGVWSAGTYTENFESGLWSWTNGSADFNWTRDSAGTPSNNTGPTTGAGGSTFYIYTEASAPNFPSKQAIIQNNNFAIAQSISFDYHMVWGNMWTLELQTFYAGTWTTRWSQAGNRQTAQWDAYENETVNLSTFPVESIRFVWTTWSDAGNGWGSDIALDNISIISN